MDEFLSLLRAGSLKVIVKPSSKKDEVLGWDEKRDALRVNIKAPAEDNKANIALVKFFSKLAGRRVRIKSGLRSKEKLLSINKS